MFALRITKSAERPASGALVRLGVGVVAIVGLYGCGTAPPPPREPHGANPPMPGSSDPNWLTSRDTLPPPDTDRIDYDPERRTLFLYDLPNRDNWMVQLPDEPVARLAGMQHRLPEGIDTTRTYVFYSRAGVKVSRPVTVAQIEAGRLAHTSMANGH